VKLLAASLLDVDSAIAHDLPRFQSDYDEEQADQRSGSL